MAKKIRHFFYPHESNNFRARLLHLSSLLVIVVSIIISTFLLVGVKRTFPSVLGISTEMTADQLLILTNQKRVENGLPPLSFSSQLSLAADNKAKDMFAKNYWAHIAPDGTTPWAFISGAGYRYVYAGENLARGFNDAGGVIDAWMASPEHRKNMLSANYKNVGFAIETGNLTGEDTVLVVEMLGSGSETVQQAPVQAPVETVQQNIQQNPTPTIAQEAQNKVEEKTQAEPQKPEITLVPSQAPPIPVPTQRLVAAVMAQATYSIQAVSKNIALAIILILLVVLILDILLVERRKIIRFTGHNLDHILYLIFVLSIIYLLTRGVIF